MENLSFPRQKLPNSKKTEKWRKSHLQWAEYQSYFLGSKMRKSVLSKKRNFNLINGKVDPKDMEAILNPEGVLEDFDAGKIQHYPIVNSKLNVLRGEEFSRQFQYKCVVTNPNSITEVTENKKKEILERVQQFINTPAQGQANVMDPNQQAAIQQEQDQQSLVDMEKYFTYSYKDMREQRCTEILNHYSKEQNFKFIFNNGFYNGMVVGEEIYQCKIEGGEPVLEVLNPLRIHCFKSGTSKYIEDSDIIIIEDYMSPAQIIDMYYDDLSAEDMKKLEEIVANNSHTNYIDSDGYYDERDSFIPKGLMEGNEDILPEGWQSTVMSKVPTDAYGNLRVMKMYWKSMRMVKKVKSINQESGREEYNFYDETYVCNEDLGETEEILWINEAWEGTKIGADIYVKMQPCDVQYNTMTNPSKCHFGITGVLYNINENKAYSLVDMAKPLSYLYDATHDRLNKLIARNHGKIINLDISMKPADWDHSQWWAAIRKTGIVYTDSFNEGQVGLAKGKLSGALNTNRAQVLDAELSQSIQGYINILEYIKNEISDIMGISRQREGSVYNRESVGGVERAVNQSTYSTEWLFMFHNEARKAALECFLETAKIAMAGDNKKFQYINDEGVLQLCDIDGDWFAESDYGIVVESDGSNLLDQQIEQLVQAGIQNGLLNFSTVLKLFSSMSISEKTNMLRMEEEKKAQEAQQERQAQQQMQQQQLQAKMQEQQQLMQHQIQLQQMKDQTSIQIANIQYMSNIERAKMESEDKSEERQQKALAQFYDQMPKIEQLKAENDMKKHEENMIFKEKDFEERKRVNDTKLRQNQEAIDNQLQQKIEDRKVRERVAKETETQNDFINFFTRQKIDLQERGIEAREKAAKQKPSSNSSKK